MRPLVWKMKKHLRFRETENSLCKGPTAEQLLRIVWDPDLLVPLHSNTLP